MGPDETWAQRIGDSERTVGNLDERIENLRNANERARIACEDAKLVAEFVHRLLEYKEVDKVLVTAARQDEDYVDAFELIRLMAQDFDSHLEAIGRVGSQDRLVEKLVDRADELRQALGAAIDAFVEAVKNRAAGDRSLGRKRSSALQFADEFRRRLQARRLIEAERAVRQAEEARDDTLRVRDQARKVAGEALGIRDQTREAASDVGAELLGKYHADHATLEAQIADRLRWVVAGLLIVIAVGAFWFNFRLGPASLATELVRLSATLPVAALAAYLASESSKHRRSAKWARDLAIAMHTLPSYVEPLDDKGHELRHILGMRVFGLVDDQSGRQGDGLHDGLTKTLDKIEGMLRRVLEMAEKRTGGQ